MPSPHKLLILYTGGTIGMQQSAAGLVPAGGFEARLRAEQQAHPERPVPHWLFRELSPLLDSANMTQHHWLAMRTAIIEAVEEEGCDAVLLLHGTDTLAYSAAARVRVSPSSGSVSLPRTAKLALLPDATW